MPKCLICVSFQVKIASKVQKSVVQSGEISRCAFSICLDQRINVKAVENHSNDM
jgi:hypothetical protein